MELTNSQTIQLPVRAQIEDASKGEKRVKVNIDGDDSEEVAKQILAFYRTIRAELEKNPD